MTTGEKLKALIEHRCTTQAKVARASLVPAAVLNSYINRGSEPLGKSAMRLAETLGVSCEWLLDDAQGMPPVNRDSVKILTLTPDDHARALIRHAADTLAGPPLYAALAAVSAALSEYNAAASLDVAAAHDPDGHAGTGGGASRRPLAGLSRDNSAIGGAPC